MAEGFYWRHESDHECVPNQSGLYCRHSQVQCEQASVEICIVMNCLGYGPEIRQARRDAQKECDRLMTAEWQGNMAVITTGSKAEGLTRVLESDTDKMCVLPDIMCIEDCVNSDTLSRETTVFTLSTKVCYHGHCRLILKRLGKIIPAYIYNALCDDGNGLPLLCTDLFVTLAPTHNHMPHVVRHERAGPSLPSSIDNCLHIDLVNCLPCHCPSILKRWAERSRHWPPPATVQKVVSLGAYVTPVGFKGSEYIHVEWRICFNTGENELVSSLNNILVYIYVLLKMVVKDILKPVKKEITSYTVKNIVMWIAENNPQHVFLEKSLFYWLNEGLQELRTAIITKHLPYYMIPERNLMAACVFNYEQKRTWVATITEMMNEGPKLILRLPKIRQAVILYPEPMMGYSKMSVELELLMLKLMHRYAYCTDENGVINELDPIIQAIQTRVAEIADDARVYLF